MDVQKIDNPKKFLELLNDVAPPEGANELMLGICHTLIQSPEIYPEHHLFHIGASLFAVRTPPFPVNIYCSGKDYAKALDEFCRALSHEKEELPGVNARNDVAELFARKWIQQNPGLQKKLQMSMRSFVLQKVAPGLSRAPGFLAKAQLPDTPLVTEWIQAFDKELGHVFPEGVLKEMAPKMIKNSEVWLWYERPEKPVSMLTAHMPSFEGIKINYVYTPLKERNKGYATTAVVSLCEKLLGENYRYITLFTDLKNPTSNSIYQKIGFQAVDDFQSIEFFKTPEEI